MERLEQHLGEIERLLKGEAKGVPRVRKRLDRSFEAPLAVSFAFQIWDTHSVAERSLEVNARLACCTTTTFVAARSHFACRRKVRRRRPRNISSSRIARSAACYLQTAAVARPFASSADIRNIPGKLSPTVAAEDIVRHASSALGRGQRRFLRKAGNTSKGEIVAAVPPQRCEASRGRCERCFLAFRSQPAVLAPARGAATTWRSHSGMPLRWRCPMTTRHCVQRFMTKLRKLTDLCFLSLLPTTLTPVLPVE